MQKNTQDQQKSSSKKPTSKKMDTKQTDVQSTKGQNVVGNDAASSDDAQDTNVGERGSLEGEGSYTASRNYDKGATQFAKSGQVDKGARDAQQAVDGTEGRQLKDAERIGKSGNVSGNSKNLKH